MAGGDPQRSDLEAKLARFDDDAIRTELRRMVRDVESKILEDFASKEREVRAELQRSEAIDQEAGKKFLESFADARSSTRPYFQKIYDFIDRR